MLDKTNPDNYPAVQFRIARPTSKLEQVINFYTNGLGLKILYQFQDHEGYSGVMIGLPSQQYHLEFTQEDNSVVCSPPTKDNLLVFYFKTVEDLNLIKKKLIDLGNQPVEPGNPYWKDKSFTFEDPDGWRVVLHNGLFNLG